MRTFKHTPSGNLFAGLPDETKCEECRCQLGLHRAKDLACPFRWVIEVVVSEHTVADGLDFKDVTPQDMVRRAFPYCNDNDINARALEAPEREQVLEAQGYHVPEPPL